MKLLASGINHIDVYQCAPAMVQHEKAHTMGADGAGVVDKAGPGASLKPGATVVVDPNLSDPTEARLRHRGRALCGHARGVHYTAREEFLPETREPLTFEEAAALPLALCTAYRQLISRARLTKGESVLIHGVGGGVMLYCLQLAAQAGAFTIVTSSIGEKLETAKSFGADACINYKKRGMSPKPSWRPPTAVAPTWWSTTWVRPLLR